MTLANPLELIETARYPLAALDQPQGLALVDRCRAALRNDAICTLPGFIPQPDLDRLVREAEALIPWGHYYDEPRSAYVDEEETAHPAWHPRRVRHSNRYRQVLNHRVPNDALLRSLFLCPELTDFVRRVLGHETLFTSACPHLALTLQIAWEGDCNGWHYDGNDGVVTLLLQEPESGGSFQYAPYIRGEGGGEAAQNYEAVSALFADPQTHARRAKISAGTFTLFNGSRSLHGVAPVGPTARPRIVAIFSYDRRPDMVFPQGYVDHVQSFPQDALAAS